MRSHQLETRALESLFDPSADISGLIAGDAVIRCRPAADEEELQICTMLRHRVFVIEQDIFQGSDRDERDLDPETIHIVGMVGSTVGGTVRIYRLDEPGLWKGDRLAVAPLLRRMRLGKDLVRCAVRTAGELGGDEMVASIQLPNVGFFEGLGWRSSGPPAPYHGLPHQTMLIELNGGNPSPA